MTDGPYARLYLSLVDDPKFAGIYEDDRHFATWARLLMIAEPAWPSSANLPRSARMASVKALADAGLIDLLPGDRYRIHGLDAERERRQEQAKKASNARWNAGSNAASNAQSMPNQAKPSPSTSQAPQPPETADDDIWQLYRAMTKATTIKPTVMDWLERLEKTYGLGPLAAAMRLEHEASPDPKTLLSRTERRVEANAKKAELEAEKRKRTDRVQEEMHRRRLELFRNTGQWDPAWGDPPEAA